MKVHFFDIEDLMTMPLRVWSNQLNCSCDSMEGNIYFLAKGCKFRVHFDCILNTYYEAKFYFYGSRSCFNSTVYSSFGSLLAHVYSYLTE